MRVIALTKYDQLGASSRTRFYNHRQLLNAAGIDLEIWPLFDAGYLRGLYADGKRSPGTTVRCLLNRILQLVKLTDRSDVLWLQSEAVPYLPAWVEKLLIRHSGPIIADYDDAIFHNYDLHPNPMVRSLLCKKIDKVMNSADIVFAGNSYLSERAKAAGAKRVEIIPTPVSMPNNGQAGSATGSRVGWIGTQITSRYLADIEPALIKLREKREFEISLLGPTKTPFSSITATLLPWSLDTEARWLNEIDVGIMPLRDSPWERGKCAYKLLQYMSVGVPTVASAVGMNSDVVDQGRSGFLVSDEKGWIDSLEQLLDDREMRLSFGNAGRRIVDEYYTYEKVGARIVDLVKTLTPSQTS